MKTVTLILLCLLCSVLGFTQDQRKLDSLESYLKIAKEDTVKANVLCELGMMYSSTNAGNAITYAEEAVKLSESLNYSEGIASGHNVLGATYFYQGNYSSALDHFIQTVGVAEETKDTTRMVTSYNNMGIIYMYQGQQTGNVADFDKSHEYLQKTLELSRIVKNEKQEAYILHNLGLNHVNKFNAIGDSTDLEVAEEYYKQSLTIKEIMNDQVGMAYSFVTLAELSMLNQRFELAHGYYRGAIEIHREIDDRYSLIFAITGLGKLYSSRGEHVFAIENFMEGLKIAESIEAKKEISTVCQELALSHESLGQYEQAYKYYKIHSQMKDSLFNEDKSKEIGKIEAKFEFKKAEEEKKRAQDELLMNAQAEEKRRNNLQYSAILMVILALAMSLFFIGRFNLSTRMLEGVIFFTFLLFFEFTLVLLDPYIETYSGGEPAYKLLFNALLAGMIFPLHSFFETKLKNRLVR